GRARGAPTADGATAAIGASTVCGAGTAAPTGDRLRGGAGLRLASGAGDDDLGQARYLDRQRRRQLRGLGLLGRLGTLLHGRLLRGRGGGLVRGAAAGPGGGGRPALGRAGLPPDVAGGREALPFGPGERTVHRRLPDVRGQRRAVHGAAPRVEQRVVGVRTHPHRG